MKLDQARLENIKNKLDEVQGDFSLSNQIQNDPIFHVLEFGDPADREVTAFIAAVFAYGNVKQVKKTLSVVFSLLGKHPAQTLKEKNGHHWKKEIPRWFKHRFNNADHLGCLLTWLGEALRRSGTLENFFLESQVAYDMNSHDHIGHALENFLVAITNLPSAPYKKSKGVLFFFPRPSGKSACKRLMLFLRWVVGTGPMDLGLWKKVPANLLLIPLDTHVLRISKHLGMTKRKDNSWRTALEITQVLKKLDPENPTRFDFALCHLGISKECPSKPQRKICDLCRMRELCVTYARGSKLKTL